MLYGTGSNVGKPKMRTALWYRHPSGNAACSSGELKQHLQFKVGAEGGMEVFVAAEEHTLESRQGLQSWG